MTTNNDITQRCFEYQTELLLVPKVLNNVTAAHKDVCKQIFPLPNVPL
jgi:hypothetical protein